ncbi:MAG: hypothetical protein ACOX34_01370 [Bacillota bacterium]|jgi:chromosome segregation ATPase|nr:hypothetical protein [Candidatus Fermentithermobacillaceae bacterium]
MPYQDLNGEIAEIDAQIASAIARDERRKSLEIKIRQARQNLESERIRLAEAKQALLKEEKDVKRLEALTFANLLYTIAGRKDGQLEKEQQELLAAKLRHDQAASAVSSLEADLESLAGELKELGDPQLDLARAFHAKEQFLLSTGDTRAKKLFELQEARTRLAALRQELYEAISAGEHVQRELRGIVWIMEAARSWSFADMLGGGVLATGLKHSKMRDASSQIKNLQQSVRKFNRELADLTELGIVLHLSTFETFADYFFDGLVIDWLIHSKINRSIREAEQYLDRIDNTLKTLRKRLGDTDRSLGELTQQREELLGPM